jgi:hypothetical protein
MAMLDNIVVMDETMLSNHSPQTKRQSKKWIKKGLPGPVKAKVAVSRTKQMLLTIFDEKVRAQGRHHRCQLHNHSPGQVLEASQEKEACDL